MNTKIGKVKLLTILKKNRKAHHAIFEEAVEGYRKEAVSLLEKNISLLRENRTHRIAAYLQVPEDHTRDYDRVIAMVEITSDRVVTLQERDFQAYVMDDWDWKRQFLTSNSLYSSTAKKVLDERTSED
jgi:hypothetical protein